MVFCKAITAAFICTASYTSCLVLSSVNLFISKGMIVNKLIAADFTYVPVGIFITFSNIVAVVIFNPLVNSHIVAKVSKKIVSIYNSGFNLFLSRRSIGTIILIDSFKSFFCLLEFFLEFSAIFSIVKTIKSCSKGFDCIINYCSVFIVFCEFDIPIVILQILYCCISFCIVCCKV